MKAILVALKKNRQDWEIKGAVVDRWVDLVIRDLDGGARGDRESQRAEDIAKANKWKLALRAGQGNSREHYEGEPAGLRLTIISETVPGEGVDRKYTVQGKEVVRKFRVHEWKRAPGTDREWFMQDNVRRYYATTGPTIFPPWKPWIHPKNCKDCGKYGHLSCGQNPTRPTYFNCKQCHLTEDCTFGTRSLEEVRRQQEENRQHIEEQKEKLVREEKERVRIYEEKLQALERKRQATIGTDTQEKVNE